MGNQINKPNTYFNTKLYTGTGATQSITGVGFQPDWTWIKVRNVADNHYIYDSVRGATKFVHSDLTSAEGTLANGLTSFNSDGFSLGDSGSTNNASNTFASWNWKAGGTAVSNTDGSITSSVSANTTAGFSVVTWTGNSGTVGHGLGVKPACIIVKSRQSVNNWVVMHQGLTGGMSTNVLVLNSTAAQGGGGAGMAEPTSDVFTITSGLASNDNNIGYVFAEKKGFSKFGSYVGNGSATDGTFVYTGFKPAFVIFKVTSTTGSWVMNDNKRNTSNVVDKFLIPNLANAESTLSTVDFLSNGFKLRTTDSGWNQSGASYIYMAFAENPLVGTNNIPTTAR